MQTIYARQGDLIVDRRDSAPVELKPAPAPHVIAGSHGGEHTVPAGTLVGSEGRVTYVQSSAADSALSHATRHRPVPLEAGQIYAVWRQIERRGDGDTEVED